MPQASGTDLRVTATFEEALARASEGARIWMEHWRSLASAGTLPRRSHLDPSAVVRILKNMSITEREDPDTLWLRLVGSGIVERFRSLPMVRISVLAGRTGADLIRNTGVVIVMFVLGMAVGFRPHDVQGVVAGALIILAFSFSLSWVMALVGLKVPNAEAAQAVAFPLLFPLTFASSAFVPVNSMPGWLQGFAAHQPVTVVVNAARGLMLGPDAAKALEKAGTFTTSTSGYVLQSLVWIGVILALAVPAAVRQFNRS